MLCRWTWRDAPVWCPEPVWDSFPTGPVGSLFLWVFNATSTPFVKPGQLKVLWRQIRQRPTKCHYWQKGCHHDGLHIIHIRIKRRQIWLALLNIRLFLLHALLQSLKHTLFTYSLNVPSFSSFLIQLELCVPLQKNTVIKILKKKEMDKLQWA